MEIYAVKIMDISDQKIDEICLWIDEDKRCKLEKFINKKDKLRTLIGELLIRTLINKRFKLSNKDIIMGKNQYGKPYFKYNPRYNFNISHSENFVVCAIDDKPIGIDIEKIKHIEYEEIAKNFFSKTEYNYITQGDLKCQIGNFYEIWTLKESVVKCSGRGLSMPLKSFSVEIGSDKNIKVIFNSNGEKNLYSLALFDIDTEYKMAVCSLSKKSSSSIKMLDQNSLINDFHKLILE
ncbi:phosphopantetheine-protein transferase domain protein [Bacillus cereus BAG5X1-1]|uniref:Phosphopantetheine-protein transferase domain protein n=1 Tax=Bacillus cereus BAG5X1-1 TaxID=1053189 RepID=J7ZM44_BACCE|nr:4'-phosphopantetheinyl transferase superfamily protein [Bacillus cereus]EJQ37426.1 phosphopantetheine-protein transferase domain protein [Bacillus cereus BAG5X1-1]